MTKIIGVILTGNGRATSRHVQGSFVGFQFGSVQDFQKLSGFGTHPGVDVGFGAFDVVMHVIAEQVNQINGIVTHLSICVSWKQDKGDVADTFTCTSISAF